MIKFIIFIYTQLYILLNIEQVFLFRRIWYPKSQQFQKYYKKKVRMSTSNRELLYFAVQVCREPWIRITEVHDFLCPSFLTSSLRHPEIFVKEFFNGFVAFHDHCPGEKLSVEWQTDLHGRHCLSHSQHLVYA